jgi:O-antigen ligase
MGPTITAIVLAFASVAGAYFFRPGALKVDSVGRAALVWLVAAGAAFMIPPTLIALFVCAVALIILAPRGGPEKAAFYLMTLPAFPADLKAALPFPGLNYLVSLDFAKIACIIVLAPTLLLSPSPPARRYAPAAGVMIVLLTIFYSIQEFRAANITSGLRASLDNMLLYAVPYFALVRLLPRTADFDKLFAGFLFVALIFGAIAVLSEARLWNFYTLALTIRGYPVFADFRYGLLRISGTLIPVVFGFIPFIGFLAVEHLSASGRIGAFATWLLRALMVGTTFVTIARGAWLAFFAGAVTYFLFAAAPRALRPIALGLGVFVAAPAAILVALNADFDRVDRFGTFEYRQKLLEASWIQLKQAPMFGDPNYAQSGNFDHLVQGQGIIDFVNFYLQIALEHGAIGLILFFGAFAVTTVGLLRLGRHIRLSGNRDLELKRAGLLAMMAGYLTMMATVSDVSLTVHFGVMTLAFGAAFVAAARREAAEAHAAPDAEGPAAVRMGDLYG